MKTTKKILKSKRGIAMESAIIFIITIFSFCSLLTMLSVIGRNQLDIENILFTREVEVDQIGEYFLGDTLVGRLYKSEHPDSAKSEGGTGYYPIADSEKYYYCVSNTKILRVYTRQGGALLLYVEKDAEGKLVRWCYSEPPVQTTQEPQTAE